ncbi:tRNA (guanosine(46)-N7)-methyltransferase TrmB [Legionella sp. W05-934-2]|uniref:tRNA (guanosine(46)-N7)-methyltransferase TrmB n=1 Tax=Legionella sp. W05-934-2 TaxID=1198649 RepID=UPI003462CC79
MKRKIRSFVRRGGRLTARQNKGLSDYFADYVLPLEPGLWQWQMLFGRNAPTIIEIGFGMGQTLVTMAEQNPELNYVGIEVHQAGIGNIAFLIHEKALTNIRIIDQDAVSIIQDYVADNSVDGFQIFFPDPWHKTKHHKRRLIQSDWVAKMVDKLKPGGFIHCATDWQPYALQMLNVLSENTHLTNQSQTNSYVPRPASRPLTKFEQRGEKLGHGVWDLIFKKE